MSGAPLNAQVRFWRDENLPGVEARSSTYTRKAFRTHTHRQCIISLVESGSTRFTLGLERHAARAGQLVVIGAGEPHACNPDPATSISYRLLAFEPGWLAGACGADHAPRFANPVVDDAELFAAWGELHGAFVRGAPTPEKQALLMACLRELVARHATPGPTERRPTNAAVDAARKRLEERAGDRVPLGELAREAGLSPHHFLRVFKAETGLPPHAYQMQQAIEHAKALLAGGAAISQAALDAGFADQSHFSRCFRRFTGATPGQYRDSNPPCGQPDCLGQCAGKQPADPLPAGP